MNKYIPDVYSESIFTINYDKLKKENIKCLLFDLDNTIVESKVNTPPEMVKKLFNKLKKMGFIVIIFSNSGSKRLQNFKDELEVDVNPRSLKPLKINFNKILKKYNLDKEMVAIIGDQLLTDILGGNRVGITTVLVDPILTSEFFFTKINRLREKRVYKKLEKNNELKKGEYYE